MTWLKKDQQILGMSVRDLDSEDPKNRYFDCHKSCLPDPEKVNYTIHEYYTREILDKRKEDTLMCDRCGKEIK